MRIVVTSRPHSGIGQAASFRVFDLAPLENDDYEKLITKLAHDTAVAKTVIDGIKSHNARIAGLLTTPLMISLLLFRYKVDHSLPENELDFFSQLFDLLLKRHDKSKPGFVRVRKSGLGDSAIEDVFNAICFLTSKNEDLDFSIGALRRYARQAAKLAVVTCDADTVVEDILDITCLILEEGGYCRFIHKSVQEYHTASFIKQQPDAVANKFYGSLVGRWDSWTQVLVFLHDIDRYRFVKWFELPELGCFLALSERGAPPGTFNRSQATEYLDGFELVLVDEDDGDALRAKGWQHRRGLWPHGTYTRERDAGWDVFNLCKANLNRVVAAIAQERITLRSPWRGDEHLVALEDLLRIPVLGRDILRRIRLHCKDVVKRMRSLEHYIALVERRQDVVEI